MRRFSGQLLGPVDISPSFPLSRESKPRPWIPACAGMTVGAVGEPDVGYFHSNTIVGMPADSQPDIEFCGGLVNEYTAIIKQDGDWWIGWIEEVPGVNCQEATREELLETLAITLREILESNKEDAIAAAGEDYQEERIAL